MPQILSKCAADIVWAAGGLRNMGYTVFNLNLGCPSATVTAKGKGAGLLQRPDELDALLADVFAASSVAVSLKSRIGYLAPEEFPRLLSIYRQYNAQELILHPRTRKEMYCGAVHMDAFALAAAGSPFPVVYNGDLFTVEDVRAFEAAHPETAAVMLGSSETTFYTISVYFGAAGIKRTRYAIPAALCADVVGFFCAALFTRLFFS